MSGKTEGDLRFFSDSRVNVNLVREKLCQERLVVIENRSWCALFKYKANSACQDSTEE